LSCLMVFVCSVAAGDEDSVTRAAAAIDDAHLRSWVKTLSDDSFEGRGPATPADERTRRYLVEQLQAMGYRPGNGDSYQQPVTLVGITPTVPSKWTFSSPGGALTLEERDDFVAMSGEQKAHVEVADSEVVFVGHGIEAPEFAWDDFKGVDVAGKVLLMLNDEPSADPEPSAARDSAHGGELFAGKRRLYYGRWTYKYESAARHRAAGAIIVHTTPSAAYPWQVVATSNVGTQFELPASNEPRLEIKSWITEAAARRLVALSGKDLDALVAAAQRRDFQPVPLGVTTSLALDNALQRRESGNVVATLPGRDLSQQAVVFTAHHDHLGVGAPDASGDKIYNGAQDNAAGVAITLGIARAFAELTERTRRAIVICLVAAEEQGLLGSKYYAAHPTVRLRDIVANVNFDGGNVWGRTRDIVFVGLGKSSLDRIAERVAATQGRRLENDQFPEQGTFYRSDQFNFARAGVPAMYLRAGTDTIGRPAGWGAEQFRRYIAERYHQPSDEYDPAWNLDGMVEDARFAFLAGVAIANDDAMPQWNPGDEFEAPHRATLGQSQ
jgi:Zn-dependent M28 family amino/carboxypeptidase